MRASSRVSSFLGPAVGGYRNWRVGLARVLADALALALTVLCLPGIRVEGEPAVSFLVVAVILGALNAFLKPLLQFLLFPFLFVTYGLVVVGLNVLILFLLAVVAAGLITIDGPGWLVVGGVLISFFAFVLENVFGVWPPIGASPSKVAGRQPRRATRLATFEESLRLQQTYNALLRYGVDMLIDRGVVGSFRRRMQALLHRPAPPVAKLATATKVRLMLEELGPTYVKVGQLASSQTNVLPDEWHAEMTKLQSSVAPFPYEQARDLISAELGAPPDELYAEFSQAPFAAASLAQVHEARLTSGERVAVKVQRPDAARQIKADVAILRAGSARLEKHAPWAREIGLAGMVDEFGKNLFNELDYHAEAYNALRLTANLEPISGVGVPQVHGDLSASRVLTLDFAEGVEVSDVAAIQAAGLDSSDVAERVVRAAVKMLLIDGFFHADPHPGNVLVNTETGRITFLDSGMVGEITVRQRFNLINLLIVGQQRDVTALAQTLLSLSEPFRKRTDERAFYKDFERKISRHVDPRATPRFTEAINASFDLLRDHGYRLDPQLVLAIKALMQASAITTTLRPAEGKSFFELGLDLTYELLEETLTADRIADAAKDQLAFAGRELLRQLPSFQEATGKWLEQYRKGRLEVYLDTSGLEQQMTTVRWVTRTIAITLALSGIVIGSAIAASVGSDIFVWLPDFALSVYVSAIAVTAVVVLVLLWRLIRGEPEEE